MKLQLGVMFGGASVEHEISILSAMQVMDHLDTSRYDIIPIYIAKDRRMYQSDACRDLKNFQDLDGLVRKLTPVSLCAKGKEVMVVSSSRWHHKERKLDVILPVLHGTYGEDGSVQGYLRMLGVPFCGCDLMGACVGQDKIVMKELLQASGIPVVAWKSLDRNTYEKQGINALTDALTSDMHYPLIVKPATLGSSVGIHIANDQAELETALADAFQYDRRVIVEQAIERMKEYNCAVLGDEEDTQTSCVEEVLKADEILSYHDKYEGNGKSKGMVSTSRIIPANISADTQATIESLATMTFSQLQASGIARIDFIEDTSNHRIYVNEINTIPGSLSFYLFEPKGISFRELLDEWIALALKRYRKLAQMIFSYDTNVLASFSSGSKMMK